MIGRQSNEHDSSAAHTRLSNERTSVSFDAGLEAALQIFGAPGFCLYQAAQSPTIGLLQFLCLKQPIQSEILTVPKTLNDPLLYQSVSNLLLLLKVHATYPRSDLLSLGNQSESSSFGYDSHCIAIALCQQQLWFFVTRCDALQRHECVARTCIHTVNTETTSWAQTSVWG